MAEGLETELKVKKGDLIEMRRVGRRGYPKERSCYISGYVKWFTDKKVRLTQNDPTNAPIASTNLFSKGDRTYLLRLFDSYVVCHPRDHGD